MLILYKDYLILSSIRVIKKLTQQYVSPFLILEKVDHLAYNLDISNNWKIYSIFSIA